MIHRNYSDSLGFVNSTDVSAITAFADAQNMIMMLGGNRSFVIAFALVVAQDLASVQHVSMIGVHLRHHASVFQS